MSEPTKEPNEQLITSIFTILLKNGLKATTMDSVAASLSMSKRTLYEIFESKKDMILRVVRYWQMQRQKKVETIFEDSETVMEALVRTFQAHQKMMKEVNIEFFLDMDKHYPEVRKSFEKYDKLWVNKVMVVINKGIEQGVFRTDVNYPIVLHLMRIQMESLKRMEEVFPPGITITDAFDSISIGFLRSIASPKGMEIIDAFYSQNHEYINSPITQIKS
ncbi:MAG: TetR/AcrR family transcriptional regulator [Muribaculaceae bacterium]|nr:TetR/AcrR family transcriptional regulator [Muribaculaceae bacterium]